MFEKFIDDEKAEKKRAEKEERERLELQREQREENMKNLKQINKSVDAKEFLAREEAGTIPSPDENNNIYPMPWPYLILRDSPPATSENVMGITFNNLAAAINILATKHGYKVISTACDHHTMYVFMQYEKRENKEAGGDGFT
jgi:hypothetical protein